MSEESRCSCGSSTEERGPRLAWFLTGFLIGAAAGILFAPKSGKETRRVLTEKTHQVGETTREFADASRDMFERGRQVIEDAADLFERGRQLVKG
jgi:gas vesicle protein